MSSGSPSKTSDPPRASSWAAPPEFYCDENAVTRSVCRRLKELGYRVHTPPELFGSRDVAEGTRDEVWLPLVGKRGWSVINRDLKIFERPNELAAYKAARIHVFLLPSQAKAAVLLNLVEINLSDMCSTAIGEVPNVWSLTESGVVPYPISRKKHRGATRRL